MLTEDIQALTAHFVANWSSEVVTLYDNQPNVTPPADELWCRFSVRPGASRHYAGSALNGEKKQQGRVWLKVIIPAQTGMGAGTALIDEFASLFRNARLDSGKVQLFTEEVGSPLFNDDGSVEQTVSVYWESFRRYA